MRKYTLQAPNLAVLPYPVLSLDLFLMRIAPGNPFRQREGSAWLTFGPSSTNSMA